MDSFKSVFAADPEPNPSPSDSPRHQTSPLDKEEEWGEEVLVAGGGGGGAWSFGGLIKTIAMKKEFGFGLKKEMVAIREVTTRAIQNQPGILDASASIAQESLKSVCEAIDDFGGSVWQGTIEIIS